MKQLAYVHMRPNSLLCGLCELVIDCYQQNTCFWVDQVAIDILLLTCFWKHFDPLVCSAIVIITVNFSAQVDYFGKIGVWEVRLLSQPATVASFKFVSTTDQFGLLQTLVLKGDTGLHGSVEVSLTSLPLIFVGSDQLEPWSFWSKLMDSYLDLTHACFCLSLAYVGINMKTTCHTCR